MRDLIVIGYPDAKTAEAARGALLTLPREDLYRISEVAVAVRDEKGAIKLDHLVHSSALSLATGSMSGLLLGLIFLHPIFGVLVGAAAGAVSEGLNAAGVSEDFVREVDDVLRPGQAALLLQRDAATKHEVNDHVVAKLAASGGNLLKTNLDASLEHKLRLAIDEARRYARGGATPGVRSAG